MKKSSRSWFRLSILPGALMLSIPAFYLILSGPDRWYRMAGSLLYLLAAALVGLALLDRHGLGRTPATRVVAVLDGFVLLGSLASAWPSESPWPVVEWLLRLAYCGLVFIRLATLGAKYIAPHRLLQIISLALVMLAIAGGGFYWLEPKVLSYADGVWLAFTTGATVGYGDLVPSTPASRIFAGFIVLLGYALFSVVTASIAALLVGEDERQMRREMHGEMRELRAEIASLRGELRELYSAAAEPAANDLHRP